MLTRVVAIALVVGAIFALAVPGFASPVLQSTLPQFIANGMTVISVTIEMADGQTIVVPITLDFTVQNSAWGGKLTVDAEVGQQPGMTISVKDDNPIVGGSIAVGVTSTPTAAPIVVVATLTMPPPTVAPVVVVPSPTPEPIVVPLPTNTPTILLFELETVGQWMAANEDMKRGNTLLWSRRLFANGTITVSAEWYANELFDCVDIAVDAAYETFGAAYSILDIAAVCIVTMGTP